MIQSWGALLDHCGLHSNDIKIVGGTFPASLTRSQTIGADRHLVSRPIVIYVCCTLTDAKVGYCRMESAHGAGTFPRDYLLPSPATSHVGCRKLELRQDTAHLMQNRALSTSNQRARDCSNSRWPISELHICPKRSCRLPRQCLDFLKRNETSWAAGVVKLATRTRELSHVASHICRCWASGPCLSVPRTK